MELASNLKRLRKAAGLTQEALAEKLHLTGQAVSRWETGDGYPEITLLPSLADLLGVSVDALLRPAALTAEERYAIEGEALRLEQAGKREESIALMEEQLRLHPEEDGLRERMTKTLLLNARHLRSEGKDAQAEISLRKAEAAAEALRASADPWLRRQPETVLPEIYYLLREKDKLLRAGSAAVPRSSGEDRRAGGRAERSGHASGRETVGHITGLPQYGTHMAGGGIIPRPLLAKTRLKNGAGCAIL